MLLQLQCEPGRARWRHEAGEVRRQPGPQDLPLFLPQLDLLPVLAPQVGLLSGYIQALLSLVDSFIVSFPVQVWSDNVSLSQERHPPRRGNICQLQLQTGVCSSVVSRAVEWRKSTEIAFHIRYREQWFTYLRDQLCWSEKKVEEWAQSLYKRTGIYINVTEYY